MRRRVQFLATQPHYRDHLAPVWDALPRHRRARFVHDAADLQPGVLTVAASFGDYRQTTGPVVYFEHGAGFSFGTDHPAYCGGRSKDRVVLFANTNAHVDARNRAAYPNADHVIVGCPKLDLLPERAPRGPRPVVAVSFHWDSRMTRIPETRTAFPHYRDALHRLVGNGWDVIGHAHPLAREWLLPFWSSIGVEPVVEFSEVLARADVYVADATSTLYEAATVMPVVVLNSPEWRRDVDYGPRFWRHLPGIEVNTPRSLRSQIARALEGAGGDRRRAAVEAIYPHRGESARLAAAAIAQALRGVGRDGGGTLDPTPKGDQGMAQARIATTRIYKTMPDGTRFLVAVPGDPIPEDADQPMPPVVEDKKVRAPRKTRSRRPA